MKHGLLLQKTQIEKHAMNQGLLPEVVSLEIIRNKNLSGTMVDFIPLCLLYGKQENGCSWRKFGNMIFPLIWWSHISHIVLTLHISPLHLPQKNVRLLIWGFMCFLIANKLFHRLELLFNKASVSSQAHSKRIVHEIPKNKLRMMVRKSLYHTVETEVNLEWAVVSEPNCDTVKVTCKDPFAIYKNTQEQPREMGSFLKLAKCPLAWGSVISQTSLGERY